MVAKCKHDKMNLKIFSTIVILALASQVISKDYKGAELRTYAAYTYGRFEVNYRASCGAGQTSTFFTYHELGSGGVNDWNELDIEMLGRYSDDIQFNTITPGQVIHVHHQWLNFDPTADFHTYAIEWTPDYIAWFVDNVEVYRQTGAHVATLNKPQKIMMNIWPPAYSSWAGELDSRRLPFRAYYDWVNYAAYTPGSGNTGTGNNFTLMWRDDFDSWNTIRWAKASHTWDGNNSDFIPDNCVFQDGKMILCLTDAVNTGLSDRKPPFVVSARYQIDTVTVAFSEMITRESAEKVSNYWITGATIQRAILQSDQRTVKLAVTGIDENNAYSLIVLGIKDLASPSNILTGQSLSIQMPPRWNYPLKINVGGSAFNDWLGDQDWEENRDYGRIGGAQGSFPGQGIAGTSEKYIFQSEQWGIVNYKVRLPSGKYRVTMLFAENYFSEAGKRVFDINVEGVYIARNFDIFSQVGAHAACRVTAEEVVIKDGILNLHFGDIIESPLLNGLIIERLPSGNSHREAEPIKNFRLEQNFPNPFNNRTTLRFELERDSRVKLTVFDTRGTEIATLVNANYSAGQHEKIWEPDIPSGVYFCRFEVVLPGRNFAIMRKMILLR